MSWPSARLLELAEAHAHDSELLEFILEELGRRDVAVANSAARRVAELIGQSRFAVGTPAGDREADREALIGTLQARLEIAERRAREAEARATAAERALSSETLPPRGQGLLRRVHLAETAPAWLVEAAHRAFRLRFHPDRFADPVMKARAEETFKDAEEIFRQITSSAGN
ncbi:hypothetical protein J5Y09_04805 [Roseomonas sp. PWR1]|uniref:J domain-containing protein n=1 Tax=Roseomonas nitratireducens TaxID=2820810 RepID=A0ABS4APE1_9PROT|nr:hypothetical protein [Neoroseomonas nitratireducens]MBP0463221.1 hypothetical protein [Neoroseomonas nitratireducens]